ncbi:hypothetical protein [Nitrospirillum sp. BR 11828]|uniref:hypothetical protein n=1 Tax=Nitrospirillum sp. BR 11828 TaxID=3104325 RepID=UPI002ACA07D8|nr:hypothetical protein [Nitrospirillum sp. BR 11828]MDZ5647313.1 hypothetical protein [Nitrospirillum sp. BR 11828]
MAQDSTTPDAASPSATTPGATAPDTPQTPAAAPSQNGTQPDATVANTPESAAPPPAQKPVKKRCPTTGSRLGGDCQAGAQVDPRQVLENRTNPSGMLPPH